MRSYLFQRRKPNKLILKSTHLTLFKFWVVLPHLFNVSKDSIDLSLSFLNLLADIVGKVAIGYTMFQSRGGSFLFLCEENVYESM